jgi:hypothetical protein
VSDDRCPACAAARGNKGTVDTFLSGVVAGIMAVRDPDGMPTCKEHGHRLTQILKEMFPGTVDAILIKDEGQPS